MRELGVAFVLISVIFTAGYIVSSLPTTAVVVLAIALICFVAGLGAASNNNQPPRRRW